jgi:hypothetical protein
VVVKNWYVVQLRDKFRINVKPQIWGQRLCNRVVDDKVEVHFFGEKEELDLLNMPRVVAYVHTRSTK